MFKNKIIIINQSSIINGFHLQFQCANKCFPQLLFIEMVLLPDNGHREIVKTQMNRCTMRGMRGTS